MGKMDDNRNSTTKATRSGTQSNRTAFRRILYVQPSPGFLSELRNPGLWNDFVVEMVYATSRTIVKNITYKDLFLCVSVSPVMGMLLCGYG